MTASPILAATLMLLRDGPAGLEVLMMVRHSAMNFAGGAMVFPGGKVEPGDRSIAARRGLAGASDEASLALKIAAIRETYEECGILLARRGGSGTVLSAAEAGTLNATGEQTGDFEGWLTAHDLEPAIDLLVPFANWITPVGNPKRFDTHFFVAKASCDQLALHDGREAVEVLWTTPAAAFAAVASLNRNLLPPTYLNMLRLGRSQSADAAIAAARDQAVFTVTPEMITSSAGIELLIPEAAGYGITRLPAGKFGMK